MHFRVWAPRPKRVEVEADGSRYPMTPSGGGWWTADVSEAGPGTDYWFHLDGGPARPDPRSAWQPEGVNGPSRAVDHRAFQWTDEHWQARPLASAVIYELHVPTFTPQGDFNAVTERLDHLVELGVTHVELMPVAGAPGDYGWGYDGVNLYAPHHAWGGPEGLKNLVNACHERGLAVLLDVVYNHLGPSGNYLQEFGPYFTDRHCTPWGWAVSFDQPGSDEVRRFFADNALMWLRDYHIDGLRIDAVHAIIDGAALHFLEQLSVEIESLSAELGRHFVLIAESDLNNPRIVKPREIGGYGIDAQWSDDFHHALHTVLTGERNGYYSDFGSMAQLAKSFRNAYVYDGCYSPARGRRHGQKTDGMSGNQFLAYLQTHDQIGNRAQGDRLGHLISPGKLKIGVALVLTSPFVPMLFQGEEWSASSPFQYFTSFEDKELGAAVREGRRHEFAAFGWNPNDVPDPQDPETFQRSKLRWEEVGHEPHAEILNWYQQLLRLRRLHPALTNGRMEDVRVAYNQDAGWLIVERDSVTVACNLAGQEQSVPVGETRPRNLLLASSDAACIGPDAVSLPAESVAILGDDRHLHALENAEPVRHRQSTETAGA